MESIDARAPLLDRRHFLRAIPAAPLGLGALPGPSAAPPAVVRAIAAYHRAGRVLAAMEGRFDRASATLNHITGDLATYPEMRRLEAWIDGHRSARSDAEDALVRALLGDPCPDAQRRRYPPRGAAVDGSLYLAILEDPGSAELLAIGECHPYGVNVMRLVVVELAAIGGDDTP